jgi:two-component system chemotaxis sensor kinase CheA
MNTSELLEQFIAEARECLEQIGRRLLDVERAPQDRELLNDLFRQVHTLKGNCGLFEFRALEQVVHAAEDVLDRVRHGDLAYNAGIADALLAAMDHAAELVDVIAEEGRLPADSGSRAQALSAGLRAHLATPAGGGSAAVGAAGIGGGPSPIGTTPMAAPPVWCSAWPESLCEPGWHAVRYVPEPECFFKGEDPWHLARTVPGLRHLQVQPQAPWPAVDAWDPYVCNLELCLVSDASADALDEHFRYVPEQVERFTFDRPAPVPAATEPPASAPLPLDGASIVMQRRLAELWADQVALLQRAGRSEGAVEAARETLRRLGGLRQPAVTAPLLQAFSGLSPHDAGALAAWAQEVCGASNPAASSVAATVETSAAPSTPSGIAALAPGAAASESRRSGGEDGGGRVLKVSQDKIDRLMDLIGEMVVAKNALPYLAQRAEEVFEQRELAREIKNQYAVINRIAEDMQHSIMQVRMLPVGTVFQRFARLVRDTSRKLGKEVRLVIEGEDTEADKNVIESLADPLIHIIRNSLDHGIERPELRRAAGKPAEGTLRVTAFQEGDRVILDISDDGAGIDTARVRAKAVERGLIPAERAGTLSEREAAQLVFLPGFSTAETISDLSGRGVGMDVVRSAVERVGGTVELQSERGQGTRVRLSLPLSMAVTNVMMVVCAGRRFGVPMDLIVETVRVPAEDIHCFKSAQTVVLRGKVVALKALSTLLTLDEPPKRNANDEHAVLVVRLGSETLGLLVDDFQGTSDIILKPLEGVLAGLTGFAGTALMGDGSVLMVLNPKELAP